MRLPAFESSGIERTPSNPAASEKLRKGVQSLSAVTSGTRIGVRRRAARAHIVPDVRGMS
jgi:hypothetical protein